MPGEATIEVSLQELSNPKELATANHARLLLTVLRSAHANLQQAQDQGIYLSATHHIPAELANGRRITMYYNLIS